MSRSFLTLLAVGGIALSGTAHAAGGQLDALKWKARPVVVLSDSRDDPRAARQISAFDHVKSDVDARSIKIIKEAEPGSALRKSLGVSEHGFAVVLVGKDGAVKKVWRDPVDPKAIFTVIDRMPMRKDEMRG